MLILIIVVWFFSFSSFILDRAQLHLTTKVIEKFSNTTILYQIFPVYMLIKRIFTFFVLHRKKQYYRTCYPLYKLKAGMQQNILKILSSQESLI